jgi:hypothetical protein
MELGVPLAVVDGCRRWSVGLREEIERWRESLGGPKILGTNKPLRIVNAGFQIFFFFFL